MDGAWRPPVLTALLDSTQGARGRTQALLAKPLTPNAASGHQQPGMPVPASWGPVRSGQACACWSPRALSTWDSCLCVPCLKCSPLPGPSRPAAVVWSPQCGTRGQEGWDGAREGPLGPASLTHHPPVEPGLLPDSPHQASEASPGPSTGPGKPAHSNHTPRGQHHRALVAMQHARGTS